MPSVQDPDALDNLLGALREQNVTLWVDGQDLRYRAPKGALTPDLLAQLRQQKTAIVNFLKAAGNEASSQTALRPRSQSGPPPLSFAQERLWFLDQLEPNNAVYNIPLALRLKGGLDSTALRTAFNEIVRRHESLRTHFAMVGDQPCQEVEPACSLEFPLIDLAGIPGPQREAEVQRLSTQEAQRPFDLAHGPLLRATLFRLGPGEHIVLLLMHHVVSDGWSIGVLLRELNTLYLAFSGGQHSPLPELPIQYADFAVWQRDWLQGQVLERQLNYWKKQLAGIPAFLELPTDRPRPANQSYRGAVLPCKLPAPLLPALADLSRREGASLFMLLLAAFQVLLHRYTGMEDVVVGSPVAGRNRAEIESLIGFFVNTLVLRGDLSGNPTFRALLGRTREAALGAFAHQDLPFEKLAEVLHPERDSSHSPLFQVMLVLQNATDEKIDFAGLDVTPMFIDSATSKYDLTLYIKEHREGLHLAVEYCTDLFEVETIRRLLSHYQTLLEGIVANPDRCLSDLPLLTEGERQQILVDWNRTALEYPQDKCIHTLFEEQARRIPVTVALELEHQRLTYQQLDERANQLGHHLRKLGVGPDSLVAICVDRSIEMVVGLLGILKAGGAYVPMDPGYPQERLAFMLQDAQPRVLLTQQHLLRLLPPHSAQVVQVDTDWPMISRDPGGTLECQTTPESLAYVLYTSGSTGKPKGVQITHRAVVNFLHSIRREPGIRPNETLLAITTLSFDIAGLELWAPLVNGAKVVIAKRETALDPADLAKLLETSGATIMQATPSTWQMLLSSGWKGKADLKVLCGGEPWSSELARQLLERCESVWNMYGPTETTIWSAATRVRAGQPMAIGYPMANTQFYVLDQHRQPVPLGIPGELWIGGDGLARGYLNRPELTAERFLPDAFSAKPGGRLYRTGDLVRRRSDGQIEFLGRIDNQVKIRGFRIELGEIESQLSQYPAVRGAVVLAREDTPGDKRLVAYLTMQNGESPQTTQLREFLQAKLPEYMIPSAFVTLERFPLMPNGKVDRKALPASEVKDMETGQTYVAPRTYLEQVLCNVWRDVLKLKRVGIRDNFFDLGGHSLLAVRLIKAINSALKTNLHVPAFFQNPNIEMLANLLAREQHAKPEPQLISLQPGQLDGALFFLEAGMGLCRLAEVFDDGPASFATIAPLPAEAYRAVLLGTTSELPSLEALAAPHTALIQSRPFSGPCMIVGHSFGGLLAFEVAHQLQRAGRRVEMIFLLDTWGVRLPWWQKLKTLTFKSARASITYRTSRLWQKGKAESAVHSGRLYAKAEQPPTSGIIPEDVNLPFGETPWEILSKVYWKARRDYRFPPLETRAILFRAQSSGLARLNTIDGNMGWSGLFKGGLKVLDCPGDHFTLLKGPNLQFLVQAFRRCTEKWPVDSPVLRETSAEPSRPSK
jgi:amino acid adenylation domain-containing protein